ncbi:MAG TPA: hypothetical protein VHN11_20480, partial [Xanthobacteraceae bacterium]|nr:hypothetical protein [Xanthobacteraceae bacterium]
PDPGGRKTSLRVKGHHAGVWIGGWPAVTCRRGWQHPFIDFIDMKRENYSLAKYIAEPRI